MIMPMIIQMAIIKPVMLPAIAPVSNPPCPINNNNQQIILNMHHLVPFGMTVGEGFGVCKIKEDLLEKVLEDVC